MWFFDRDNKKDLRIPDKIRKILEAVYIEELESGCYIIQNYSKTHAMKKRRSRKWRLFILPFLCIIFIVGWLLANTKKPVKVVTTETLVFEPEIEEKKD